MGSDNRIIQGLWIGPSLSVMEQLSIRSFLANGHEYHLYVYEKPSGVPDGTVLKDASEVLNKDRIWRSKHEGFGKGSVSGFADLFRYVLLHRAGGWWVDTDVICLRPFDHSANTVISSSDEGEHGILPCNFVLKFPAGGPLTAYLVGIADRTDVENIGYLEIGPFLIQRMVRELELQQYLASPSEFAPIGWRSLSKIVHQPFEWTPRSVYRVLYWRTHWLLHPKERPGRIVPESYAIHMWNEFWNQQGYDKNQTFAKSCVYERLKRRYLDASPRIGTA